MNDKLLDRLLYMDNLISRKATGCPSQFAKKLSISERTLYRWIAILRNRGICIEYDEGRGSYFYEYKETTTESENRFLTHFSTCRTVNNSSHLKTTTI